MTKQRSSKQWSKCLLLSGLSICFAPAYANDAVVLLNQMNDALHQLEYQGKLVFLKDGENSNLSILHTIENGKEKEVVSLLDENGDEYIKESTPFSLSALPKITTTMQKVYSFDLGGMGKVAGRPCRIVLARPKDRKRYLQKYCIDLDRNVVLKYSLINQKHELVESFMFTDFKILSHNNVAAADTSVSAEEGALGLATAVATRQAAPVAAGMVKNLANSFSPVASFSEEKVVEGDAKLVQAKAKRSMPTKASSSAKGSSLAKGSPSAKGSPDYYTEWFFDSLPAGFKIVSADKIKLPEGEDEHIIISDGLSSVSVFISADKNVTKPPVQPISSGALNILSRMHEGYAITMVGEVPKSTLQDIFKGIKKATITE